MACSPRLRQLTPLTLLLPLLVATGCETREDGPEPLECPATGAVLLPDKPTIQPEDGPGCHDSESWTADADPANPTWTIEADPLWDFGSLTLRPLGDGVALAYNNEIHAYDGEGRSLWQRSPSSGVAWSTWQTTEDGRMIIADTPPGGGPQYRVFDQNGVEIWLRLLDSQTFSSPTLALMGEDALIGLVGSDPETFETVIRIQRWELTGTLKDELQLPFDFFSAPWLVLDGQDRLGVYDGDLEIFDTTGTSLGVADMGDDGVTMIVGGSDGFFAVGIGESAGFVRRYAGDGERLWTKTFEAREFYGSRISAAAALPNGGVVIAGHEDNIEKLWPDSSATRVYQPFVLALDADGNPMWGERYAANGEARAVTIGFGGEVYVAGFAQATEPDPEYGWASDYVWLRRYDP